MVQTFLLEDIVTKAHYKQAVPSHVLLTHRIILYQIQICYNCVYIKPVITKM